MRSMWMTLLILILGLQMPCFGQEKEYRVKAVFLEKFTRLIKWPDTSDVSDTSKPFVIAVIGKNPFGSILETTYVKQKIKGKRVEIQYISKPDEIVGCHLLFISSSNRETLSEIISLTQDKPILTVSDSEGFAEEKVLINFYLSGNKTKFEVNERAVHKSGLVFSYMLLNLARIVDPMKGGK